MRASPFLTTARNVQNCSFGYCPAQLARGAVRKQILRHTISGRSVACAAPGSPQTSVFLSHAGEQKKIFVDVLYHVLTEEGMSVFMDEHSLAPGTPEAWQSIVGALNSAAVGVARVLCDLVPLTALPPVASSPSSAVLSLSLVSNRRIYARSGGGALARICAQGVPHGGAEDPVGAPAR